LAYSRLLNMVNIHLTSLRPFHFDSENVNPIDVANRDAFATVVEAVIDHHPKLANYSQLKRSELEFKVRWQGLSPDLDRFTPYKELRNNPRLHEYLINMNMRTFIPPEHKT